MNGKWVNFIFRVSSIYENLMVTMHANEAELKRYNYYIVSAILVSKIIYSKQND